MHDAFISYSTADSAEAYSVRNFLRRSGCTCWMAPDDIPAGSDYAEAIPKGIAECRVFILILSVDAQNSVWVRRELGKAIDKGKVILPFMLSDFKLNDTFDFLLENAQWCYAHKDRNAALQKMLAAVKSTQGTYTYTPPSGTKEPKSGFTPPTTTSTPKQPVPPKQPDPPAQKKYIDPRADGTYRIGPPKKPNTASAPAKKRSADPKVTSKWLYWLVTWGCFWALTGVLLGLSMYLSANTPIGDGAMVITGLGIPVAIILTVTFHKKDRIHTMIRKAKSGNFIRKFLLWVILGIGIFMVLGPIVGLICTQIMNRESLTQDQTALLAVVCGVLSLTAMGRWLKKYTF